MNGNQTSRKIMSYLHKREKICDEWLKFDWEYNIHGDIVRGQDFTLTSQNEFGQKRF